MTADEYRRQAFEAQRQGASAANAFIKAQFEQLARHWLALAEQVEWLDRRFGSVVSPVTGEPGSLAMQQQQQVQPKGEDKNKKD
jgi:hypothetical protein